MEHNELCSNNQEQNKLVFGLLQLQKLLIFDLAGVSSQLDSNFTNLRSVQVVQGVKECAGYFCLESPCFDETIVLLIKDSDFAVHNNYQNNYLDN